MDDNVKKALNLLVLATGVAIICTIIFFWVEAKAKQTKAQITLFAFDAEWQYFQYQQSLRQDAKESSRRQ